MKHLLFIFFLLSMLLACKSKSGAPSAMSAAFSKPRPAVEQHYDLEDIRHAGELIIVTLSGPETYYDYHGVPMGLQYVLAENFAHTEGLKVRVEVVPDTATLLQKVRHGEADIAALPVSRAQVQKVGLLGAGVCDERQGTTWAVRKSASELAEALRDWFRPSLVAEARKTEVRRLHEMHEVRRHAQAIFLSRTRGIISVYDPLFRQASSVTGWDWRLIAAQCYQESGFDPNAASWAGARGLMQLMPRTAAELGVSPTEVTDPRINIEAAARLIRQLSDRLSDVPDATERIKFVLAAYNGGIGHIRDAMALSRKYGHNSHRWEEVSPYILGLQQARYYRDPVVKYGYMIGTETTGYVQSILERWQSYGGQVIPGRSPIVPVETPSTPTVPQTGKGRTQPRKNKYSSGLRIMSPDDPEFNQMKP